MAKKGKGRRPPRQASPARYTAPKSTTPTAAPPARGATVATVSSPRAPAAREPAKTVNFAEEYRYVYEDLRRVALLAGTILLILLILSFVIR